MRLGGWASALTHGSEAGLDKEGTNFLFGVGPGTPIVLCERSLANTISLEMAKIGTRCGGDGTEDVRD